MYNQCQVQIHSSVLRDGQVCVLPSHAIVRGDVVLLSAGSLIPADGVVLASKDFFINQAVLTGETFPVEKKPGVVSQEASLGERSNGVFMGTSVSSGTARMLVVQTGTATVFGQIAGKLALRPPMTEFERGVQRFGYLLTRIMLVMVVVVLAINMLMHKPAMDSLLFALALAVGLTPELLALEGGSLKVRFDSTDAQSKPKTLFSKPWCQTLTTLLMWSRSICCRVRRSGCPSSARRRCTLAWTCVVACISCCKLICLLL